MAVIRPLIYIIIAHSISACAVVRISARSFRYRVFGISAVSLVTRGLSSLALLSIAPRTRYPSSVIDTHHPSSLSPSLVAKGLSFFSSLLLKRFAYLVAVALFLAAKRLWSLAFQARCSSDVPVVALHPGACRPVACRQSYLVSCFLVSPLVFHPSAYWSS